MQRLCGYEVSIDFYIEDIKKREAAFATSLLYLHQASLFFNALIQGCTFLFLFRAF
jgi:hypothetical protein